MSRNLAYITDEEWRELMDMLVTWLRRRNIAGSIAGLYSLYRALDDERDFARKRVGRSGESSPKVDR